MLLVRYVSDSERPDNSLAIIEHALLEDSTWGYADGRRKHKKKHKKHKKKHKKRKHKINIQPPATMIGDLLTSSELTAVGHVVRVQTQLIIQELLTVDGRPAGKEVVVLGARHIHYQNLM